MKKKSQTMMHELKRREATDAFFKEVATRLRLARGERTRILHRSTRRRRRRAAERAQEHSPSIMSNKRGAGSELNRDNYEREIEREGSEEAGTWQKADEVRLASRLRLPPRSTC